MTAILKVFKHREIMKPINKGKFLGNYKCHWNSLDYSLKHPTKVKRIVGCLQVYDDNEAYAHFVCELMDGTIIDPTFGRLSTVVYKYLIPIEYYEISTFNPNRELGNLKEYLHSKLPWYIKLFKNKSGM